MHKDNGNGKKNLGKITKKQVCNLSKGMKKNDRKDLYDYFKPSD